MLADSHALPRHQFDDVEQQQEVSSLGMWVFLVTEIMFFGGLFTGYAVYRAAYPAAFAAGSHHLDIVLGGVNTAVLIGSSLTMALAVHSAQIGERSGLVRCLLLTMLLGLVFLGIKGVEYAHKFEEHLVPGRWFVSRRTARRAGAAFFRLLLQHDGDARLTHDDRHRHSRGARLASLARPLFARHIGCRSS